MLETLNLTVNSIDEVLIVTIRGTTESRRFSMTNGLEADDLELIISMLHRSKLEDKTAPAKLSFGETS